MIRLNAKGNSISLTCSKKNGKKFGEINKSCKLFIFNNFAKTGKQITNNKKKYNSSLKKKFTPCSECKHLRQCRTTCNQLENYLKQFCDYDSYQEILIANVDNSIGANRASLKLAEMETEVVRYISRHNMDLGLTADDWSTVEKSSLSKRQKMLMYKHFWQKKTMREIASELKISSSAVGAAISRAKKKLKLYLFTYAKSL